MKSLLFIFVLYFLFPGSTQASVIPDIIINEVAWMGTKTSANDEWIELYNQTGAAINVEGWTLKAADGSPKINLTGAIPTEGFWLLERTDDNTLVEINADQIYTGALNNNGETLELYDNIGKLIDLVAGSNTWPAGDNTTKQTMSRFDLNQWRSSKEPGGTPKTQNTFAADTPEVQPQTAEIKPQPTSPSGKEDSSAVSGVPEAEPQVINRELAAVGQQATQKSPFPFLIAGVLAIFSGIVILFLKKGLK